MQKNNEVDTNYTVNGNKLKHIRMDKMKVVKTTEYCESTVINWRKLVIFKLKKGMNTGLQKLLKEAKNRA